MIFIQKNTEGRILIIVAVPITDKAQKYFRCLKHRTLFIRIYHCPGGNVTGLHQELHNLLQLQVMLPKINRNYAVINKLLLIKMHCSNILHTVEK